MAIVRKNYCTMNQGLVTLDYDYDDVSLLLEHFYLTNNGTFGHLTVTVYTLDGSTLLFGPVSLAINLGSLTQDISALNLKLISVATKRGQSLEFPVLISCGWSSA